MKKQFNKKKLLTLLVLPLFCLVLVNAALVGFLSNTVTAEVEVKSPMILGISLSENEGWSETLSLPVMYTGGDNVVTFYTSEENHANVAITGNIKNIVTSSGITCADFESVVVNTRTLPAEVFVGEGYDLIGLDLCVQVNPYTIEFNYPNPLTWDAGQVDINEIVVTFNDVVGKYIFTSQVIPAQ